jgi:hypothetical protein
MLYNINKKLRREKKPHTPSEPNKEQTQKTTLKKGSQKT